MKKNIIITILSLFIFSAAYAINVGDKVVLDKNAERYSTGELIPDRFRGMTYTAQQVYSSHHPNSILLKEIYSWAKEKDLTVASTEEEQNNVLHVADSQVDKRGNRFVILYDTVYIDGGKKWQSKDTIYIVKKEEVNADSIAAADANAKAEQEAIDAAEAEKKKKGFDRFSIGLRGGASYNDIEKTGLKGKIGYEGFLDIQYAHYFNRRSPKKAYCGILTGVSAGYVSTRIGGTINDQYTTTDAEGDVLDYTITVENMNTTLNQIQVQVPLMFALKYRGLFFNIGPRFVVPVYNTYTQTLDNAHIAAHFADYGYTSIDNLITGRLTDDQLNTTGTWESPIFQLFASFEIGYEFSLKNGHTIGLGVYADYCAYSTYKRNATSATGNSLISVSQVGADPANPAPTVDVLPSHNVYADKFKFCDFGLKLVYNCNFFKK